MSKALMVAVVAVVLAVGMVSVAVSQENKGISEEQITATAVQFITENGLTLDEVDIVYDDGNDMWEERAVVLETDTSQNHGILPHGVLKSKDYQVVYFDYVEHSPNKDVWVFVDKETGKVAAYYEER